MKKKRPEFMPHYAGHLSRRFWDAVNGTEDMVLYHLGCVLQEVELRVLRELNAYPKKRTRSKRVGR